MFHGIVISPSLSTSYDDAAGASP